MLRKVTPVRPILAILFSLLRLILSRKCKSFAVDRRELISSANHLFSTTVS